MNQQILFMINDFLAIYEILGDTYRANAYLRARAVIRGIKYPIDADSMHAIRKLPGIGKGIATRIKELINTGICKELDELKKSPRVQLFRTLKILGAGTATIDGWIAAGIHTRNDLHKVKLTKIQQWGLTYYDDLRQRIPRAQVTAIGEHVKKLFMDSSTQSQHKLFEIVGSYRRGAQSSGDVDIIISTRLKSGNPIHALVDKLSAEPQFVGIISKGPERVSMLYKHAGTVRQVDILYVPQHQYACALLYFTGSPEFNETMRGFAKSKGMRLNQHGLYRRDNGELKLIVTKSEEDIFKRIGMQYVAPRDRI